MDLLMASGKKRVLLHACCGPCASSCIERLAPEYSVTVFYYNPNITDEKEYYLRKSTLEKFILDFNSANRDLSPVAFIEGDYHPLCFIRRAEAFSSEPEGGKRCDICFEMRLAETARVAKDQNFDYFTTTLTVSPHKDYERITRIGKGLASGASVEYLDVDFKKKNGYQRSIELSKEYGLYRQNFCGCEYAR